jgi:hypothetical protein
MVRLPKARRALKWVLRAGVAAACLFAAGALLFALHCSDVRGGFQPSPPTTLGRNIPGYARPEDDTFLTYAEWYIVWSYLEKAAWQEAHLPSGFPYFGAIRQYWSGYCCSYGVVRGRYAFNFGDHLMLVVIGTSFTVEYGIKGIYENSVGRLTEWLAGEEPVEEDRYAARVARNYGVFVEDRPFYEFPFFSAFRALWKETSLWGPHVFRKWERKAWLSLDYGIEAVYCGLIRLASHAVYGIEEDVTYALIENAPEILLASVPFVQRVNSPGPGSFIVQMPRYQKFTDAAGQLLRRQARFVEIAGNSQIMVTAVVPRDWNFQLPAGELLFSSEVLTDPQSKRVALRVPVAHLGAIADKLAIEHIYDY